MLLSGPWLGLNSGPRPLHALHSTAYGAQVIRPLDYTGRHCTDLCDIHKYISQLVLLRSSLKVSTVILLVILSKKITYCMLRGILNSLTSFWVIVCEYSLFVLMCAACLKKYSKKTFLWWMESKYLATLYYLMKAVQQPQS